MSDKVFNTHIMNDKIHILSKTLFPREDSVLGSRMSKEKFRIWGYYKCFIIICARIKPKLEVNNALFSSFFCLMK